MLVVGHRVFGTTLFSHSQGSGNHIQFIFMRQRIQSPYIRNFVMCFRVLCKNSFGPPAFVSDVTLNSVKVATLKTEAAALSKTLPTSLPNSTVS